MILNIFIFRSKDFYKYETIITILILKKKTN